eukprot:496818_1
MSIFVLICLLIAVQSGEDTCSSDDTSCILSNKILSTATIELNDGNAIPIIGLGTYTRARTKITRKYLDENNHHQTTYSQEDIAINQKQEIEFKNAVITGLKSGYKHIDSAIVYRTEHIIGEALQEIYKDKTLNIKREDIWITTKIPSYMRNMNDIRNAIEQSLKSLKTDYIDLYLIHSPHTIYDKSDGYNGTEKAGSDVLKIYKMLLEYKNNGKIKSVGVSNFGIKHLKSLKKNGLPIPSVNQIEVSVFLQEGELIEYCEKEGIVIEAYSPISQAHEIAVKNELLNELADKYSKQYNKQLTFAHIMIGWCVQKGFVVLPKSITPKRIIANGDVFDFKIIQSDMKRLDALGEAEYRVCWNPLDILWEI